MQDNQKQTATKFKKPLIIILITVGLLLLLAAGTSTYVFVIKKDTKQANVSTASSTNAQPTLNQDALNANRPTGKELEDEVTKTKADIEKLNADIKATPAPKTADEQVALAKKYLQLGNLYIVVFDYPNAAKALTKVYDTNVISQATLNGNQKINMDTQGAFGLMYYNMGKYNLALDSYNKALAIASLQAPYEGADVFSPADVIKYQEAINSVKAKM